MAIFRTLTCWCPTWPLQRACFIVFWKGHQQRSDFRNQLSKLPFYTVQILRAHFKSVQIGSFRYSHFPCNPLQCPESASSFSSFISSLYAKQILPFGRPRAILQIGLHFTSGRALPGIHKGVFCWQSCNSESTEHNFQILFDRGLCRISQRADQGKRHWLIQRS